jgi:TRAP-type mannitol/chloroaromatic compound transport system substrate-binding protein
MKTMPGDRYARKTPGNFDVTDQTDDPTDPDGKNNSFLRRSFLTGLGATAAAAGVAATTSPQVRSAAQATANKTFELNMVTTWPKNFPGLGTAAERFAQRVDKATDGSVKIKVYAAGELVPAMGSFDAVQRGLADMYHGCEYYWQGKSKAFNFFATVPFGLTADEMSAWIRWGGGQELWNELSARYSIKPFMIANSGVQMGGWFKEPINSLEDLKGLKIRMPGLGGEVLNRLGAASVTLPGSEIFQALQSGAIDGTEWVGPWNDLALGFYNVAKNYYCPGFHEPGTVMSLGINLDVWNSMALSQQTAVESAATAEVEITLAEFNAKNAVSYQEILEMPDVTVRSLPDGISVAIAKTAKELLVEISQEDEFTKRVYDSFVEFRERSIAYNLVSEYGYARTRMLERLKDA